MTKIKTNSYCLLLTLSLGESFRPPCSRGCRLGGRGRAQGLRRPSTSLPRGPAYFSGVPLEDWQQEPLLLSPPPGIPHAQHRRIEGEGGPCSHTEHDRLQRPAKETLPWVFSRPRPLFVGIRKSGSGARLPGSQSLKTCDSPPGQNSWGQVSA